MGSCYFDFESKLKALKTSFCPETLSKNWYLFFSLETCLSNNKQFNCNPRPNINMYFTFLIHKRYVQENILNVMQDIMICIP